MNKSINYKRSAHLFIPRFKHLIENSWYFQRFLSYNTIKYSGDTHRRAKFINCVQKIQKSYFVLFSNIALKPFALISDAWYCIIAMHTVKSEHRYYPIEVWSWSGWRSFLSVLFLSLHLQHASTLEKPLKHLCVNHHLAWSFGRGFGSIFQNSQLRW